MSAEPLTARLGVFVAVLVVAAAAGTGAALVGTADSAAPPAEPVSATSFNSGDAVATAPEESGSLSLSADAEGKVVVIDAGHGAAIDREALAPLVETLTANGARVRYFAGERPLNATLREADAFVVYGADRRYTPDQLAGIEAFTDAGGRVLLMSDPQSSRVGFGFFRERDRGQVPDPLAPLASQYGLAYGNGYLFNVERYDTNYRDVYATPTGDGLLTAGVESVVVHEGVPVRGGQTVLATTPETELSETRRSGRYGVVARSGNVTAVGSTSLVSQDHLYRADNEVLAGNLLAFLVGGEKRPEDAPTPAEPDGERPRPGPERGPRPAAAAGR